MSSLPQGKQVRGLTRCWCGYWYQPLLHRKEPLKKTVTLFRPDDRMESNLGVLFRPSFVYATDSKQLERVRDALIKSPEITKADVVNVPSDIGLPWKVTAQLQDGKSIEYDGLLFYVSEPVSSPDLDIAELGADPGWPMHIYGELRPLGAAVASVVPRFDDIGSRTLRFYTAEQVDWAALKILAEPRAQLRLTCIDPRIHTITGLTDHSVGRPYHICLGRPDDAREMMAHALAQNLEVELAISYCDALRKETTELGIAMAGAYEQLLAHASQLRGRYGAWRTVKKGVRRLVVMRSEAGRLDLLRMALEEAVARRFTATNGPVQIFNPADPPDPQTMVARVRTFFHSARVENGQMTEITDTPVEPPYAEDVAAFAKKRQLLSDGLATEVDEGRNTIVAFQTEFSWYALLFALLGIVIALAAAVLSVSAARGDLFPG